MKSPTVRVIGAGLAGSEAAWQLAQNGVSVKLYEMRGKKSTPAHETTLAAELVCSNSFRAEGLSSAAGLLKEEMRLLKSLILEAADATAVLAGAALAVDRHRFSQYIDDRLSEHPCIQRIQEEVTHLDGDELTIVATGPLTSLALHEAIQARTEEDTLYFYDAAAPILMAESIDMEHAYWKSRYDKGEATDYLNCPMDKRTYDAFYTALMKADWVPTRDFEEERFFEGCMPIEVMAQRGYDTLRHGPFKPVGLERGEGFERPYAVLQLRREDKYGLMLNMVGCQTRMTWPAQREVFSLIPALAQAEFARYGVMHRNTFMNSPKLLDVFGRLKTSPHLLFAGQMTGVEGYLESAASGLVAGLHAARLSHGLDPFTLPETTAIGSLLSYVTQSQGSNFQPMHVTFGLLPPLAEKIRSKKERNEKISKRALKDLQDWVQNYVKGSF